MAVYVIERGDGFTGMIRGVDFWSGRGSTSCLTDIRAFLEMGFQVSELGTGCPVKVKSDIHPDARVEILTVVPAPVQATGKGEGASAPSPDSSPVSTPGSEPEGAPARKPARKRAATRRGKG